MRTYVARRVLLFIQTLVLVSIILFIILRVLPGDIASIMMSAWG